MMLLFTGCMMTLIQSLNIILMVKKTKNKTKKSTGSCEQHWSKCEHLTISNKYKSLKLILNVSWTIH